MNVRRIPRFDLFALLCACLLLPAGALAANELEPIIVTAGAITKTVVEYSDIGVPTELVTLTHRVGYADLDLTTHAGAMELKHRVEAAARLACKQLDRLYPADEPEAPKCIRKAVADASRQVDRAIGAAEHAAKEK